MTEPLFADRSDRNPTRLLGESACGVAAATLLHGLASFPASLPPTWFALCLGLAHLGFFWPGGGPWRRRPAGAAAMLALAATALWLAVAASGKPAGLATGLFATLLAFGAAATAAGRLFAVLLPPPALAAAAPAAIRPTTAAERANALPMLMKSEAHWAPASDAVTPAQDPVAQREDAWLDPERLSADWMDRAAARHEGVTAVAARRALDLLLSGGLLVVTLPVLLLTALAIRLESRGPIFYRQERVGRDGRVFTLFKFRSMAVDAEAAGKPVWAVPQDPRVTRVGRFIRLTRIDEVPQVLNVLRGEMAFIGPRPERPVFVAQLERIIPHYADRAAVKPGITGWAQVRYRYGASVEDARMKLGYDLFYIRHRSLALDLRILAGTVRVVVFQEGAR